MAYTALYRKFRPLLFSEMVGQEHITRTLKNQIIAGRVGHAYLFNGGRGTGKTSGAKILARAINCLNPKDGEPCNECEICKAAIAGTLTDIVEMDAASNNSVEDIRQIRDEVNFLPTVAKYRVYIIDEVHMLSTGAFNALLKTLEEPPAHVKFILATTEPQKLPATILSRCQRFDFKKISNEDIKKRLKFVCDESKIDITEGALNTISVLSQGAMRDALSILERCIQDGNDKIDEDQVRDLIGIPKFTYINKFVNLIIDYNVEESLKCLDEILQEGKDLNNLLWEMIKYVKDVLVFKTTNKLEIYNDEEIEKIKELSQKVDKQRLLDIVFNLSNLENEIKYASQKVIIFEAGIIRLCNKENNNVVISNNINNNSSSTNIDDYKLIELNNRISDLEKKLTNLNSGFKMQNTENNSFGPKEEKLHNTEKSVEKPIIKKPAINLTIGEKLDSWPKIVTDLKQSGKIMLYTNLMNSVASTINDLTVGIDFPNGLTPFGKTIIEKSENMQEIEKRISMEVGKPMKIKLIDEKFKEEYIKKQEVNPIETLAKDMDLPFNVVE